ncbi:hypothetical protein [Streptomyces antnestii]|uniref:hypothetical protein n=1 Tax=Streptomyces antnestii TaxID=2494256 RepID=UPI0016777A26|nr:hypothetical protein [Streptomyces sp. San01]
MIVLLIAAVVALIPLFVTLNRLRMAPAAALTVAGTTAFPERRLGRSCPPGQRIAGDHRPHRHRLFIVDRRRNRNRAADVDNDDLNELIRLMRAAYIGGAASCPCPPGPGRPPSRTNTRPTFVEDCDQRSRLVADGELGASGGKRAMAVG